MPAGIPEPANAKTSKEVKSGRRNSSFSNSFGHGKRVNSFSALYIKKCNLKINFLEYKPTKNDLPINQFKKFSRLFFIHHSNKTFKFSSHSNWVTIRFDKTNICFDSWSFILNPMSNSIEKKMSIQISNTSHVCMVYFSKTASSLPGVAVLGMAFCRTFKDLLICGVIKIFSLKKPFLTCICFIKVVTLVILSSFQC